MAYGQLGAVIIRENVSSGDGSLEIMIPGHRINTIMLLCKINNFCDIMEKLDENSIVYIVSIIHYCG